MCFRFRSLVKLHSEVIQAFNSTQSLCNPCSNILKGYLIIYMLSSGKSAKGSDLQKSDLLDDHYYPAGNMLRCPDGPVEPLLRSC